MSGLQDAGKCRECGGIILSGMRCLDCERGLTKAMGITSETMGVPCDEGRKDDGEKVRADLYSGSAYLATCRGLTYGVKKYAAWNWAKGILYSRVYGALIRHLFAWFMGQEKDPESGLSHLDHAGCCLMFLQHYHEHPERYARFDDRPNTSAKTQYVTLSGEDLEKAKAEFFR